MEKIKNKFEIILGFVTLIVSLSAFKDELKEIHLRLGYITINASTYFLYCVYGFSLCLYFYIMETVFRDTKIGSWKIWDYIVQLAFIIFVFILITPIFISINILIYKGVNLLPRSEDNKINFSIIGQILEGLGVILTPIFSFIIAIRLYRENRRRNSEQNEEIELRQLDISTKLFTDGYYSQSVLESFKVLENHLINELDKKNIRSPRTNFNKLLDFAIKANIVELTDIPIIKDLRQMRNVAAHSNSDYTRYQAEKALNYVRELLNKSSKSNK